MRLPYPRVHDLDCPNCLTTHQDVPVAMDEDGPYVALDTIRCECGKELCTSCPQFTCESCNGHFCLEASHIGDEQDWDCTCVQTDVDQVDSCGCRLHDPRPGQSATLLWCRTCAVPEVEEVVLPKGVGFEAAFEQMEVA